MFMMFKLIIIMDTFHIVQVLTSDLDQAFKILNSVELVETEKE